MAGSNVAKEQRTGKILPVHFMTSTGTTVLTLNAGTVLDGRLQPQAPSDSPPRKKFRYPLGIFGEEKTLFQLSRIELRILHAVA